MLGAVDLLQVDDAVGGLDRLGEKKLLVFGLPSLQGVFAEELARLHYFSVKKRQPEGEIEFVITVKEFASSNAQHMRFYAQADREINQKTAPFRPFGWGDSLPAALTECLRAIRQFPYEGEVSGAARVLEPTGTAPSGAEP